MDKTSLQMLFGVLLGVFLLALIVMTVVYVRRKLADKREEALRDLDLMQEEAIREEQSQSKGYWINRDDIEDENQAHLLRYYHYFDNIDECIHDLIVEMYDCGFVRTEEIFVAAYGEEALTPDSFIYMTDADCDLEKAKALMKEAGFEDGFDVELIVDNTTIEMQGAEFVKQQMAEINIDVNVEPQESTVIADRTSAPEDQTEVQMWYVNWSSGSYEADGSMRSILHGDKYPPAGYNTAFYNNAEFNKLLDDALVATDSAEIAELYSKAQAIAWEECPWIFLANDNSISAMRSYVKGLTYKPGGDIVFTTAELAQ